RSLKILWRWISGCLCPSLTQFIQRLNVTIAESRAHLAQRLKMINRRIECRDLLAALTSRHVLVHAAWSLTTTARPSWHPIALAGGNHDRLARILGIANFSRASEENLRAHLSRLDSCLAVVFIESRLPVRSSICESVARQIVLNKSVLIGDRPVCQFPL